MDQTCLLAYLEEMEPAMEDSLISTPYATDREIGAEQHPSESFQVQPVDAGTAEHCLPACASRHQLCPDWLAACCTDVIPVGQTPYAAAAAAAATPTPWAAQDSSVRGWLHSSYTQAGVSSALHCSSLAAAATAPWGAEPLACAAAVAGSGCTVECCTTGGADSSSHGDPACSEDTVVAAAVVAAAAAAAAAGCSQAGDAATTTAAHMPQTASEARRAAHAREKRREAFTVSQRQLQKKKQDEVVKLQDEVGLAALHGMQLNTASKRRMCSESQATVLLFPVG